MRRWWLALGALFFVGCDDGGGDAGPTPDAALAADAGVMADAALVELPDGEVGPVVGTIPGDITYATVEGPDGLGHLYAVAASGQSPRRITQTPGRWGHHAVAPGRRMVAAVRHPDDDPGGPGEVWVIDLRGGDAYAISPRDCDAGAGGLGWRDERQLLFAMQCEDGVGGVWASSVDNTARDRALMLPLTAPEVKARDVTVGVSTPLYAFSQEEEICDGARCATRSTLWVGNIGLGSVCRVTDGDPQRADPWLGDREPAFTYNLGALVFARHVPEKGDDHYDTYRVALDVGAAFNGDEICGRGGTLAALTGALFDDDAAGTAAPLSERTPQPLTELGGAESTHLFVGQWADGAPRSGIFLVDVVGGVGQLLESAPFISHARWIVTEYDTTGDR